jgi:DNA-binding LacI/PurR family transcriptional regulator
LSNQNDEHFTNAFMRGIKCVAAGKEVDVVFHDNRRSDVSSLSFGDSLLDFGVDGIVALSFRDSALPFYHVIREGVDMIADVILDDLPILPAIQTDNHLHARKAGELMIANGYRRLLMVGYYPQTNNHRYEGFCDVVKDHCESIEYVCLSEIDAMKRLDRFFNKFSSECGVFSNDYSASYIVGAKFIQFGVLVTNDNFIVYDSEDDYFRYAGLGDVRAIAPSLVRIGKELCEALITKWETGSFPLPLQRRI